MKKLTPLIVLGLFLVSVVLMIFGMKDAMSVAHPAKGVKPQITESIIYTQNIAIINHNLIQLML